jgi:N4-gp56 family major capsid protein
MARTTILPNDPNKRRAWAAAVAEDAAQKQYFARMCGPEGSRSAVIKKTELEKGAGDEVTTALVAKLQGRARREGEKLAGQEFRLTHASHTMRINEHRHGVNVGARIEQSRVGYNLKKQGREKLTEYIKELYEHTIVAAAAGARGVGEELHTLEEGYAGYPNALRAPSPTHLYAGTNGDKVSGPGGTIVAGDRMNLAAVNKLRTKAVKMLGGTNRPVKMQKVSMGGKDCFVLAVCPEVMQDIRDDSGTQGWFEAQKALTTSIGKESEIFKGGAGMFNGVLIDEMEFGVYFNNFGAGSNVLATRSFFMGANALMIAHGTKGMADGMTVSLDEDTDDRKHDAILFFEMIFGADKAQFDGRDYGMMSVDTSYTPAV